MKLLKQYALACVLIYAVSVWVRVVSVSATERSTGVAAVVASGWASKNCFTQTLGV